MAAYLRALRDHAHARFRARFPGWRASVIWFLFNAGWLFALLYWSPWFGVVKDEFHLTIATVIALFLSAAFLYVYDWLRAPLDLWRDDQKRILELSDKRTSKLYLTFDPDVLGCRISTRFANGMPVTFFRIKVEHQGIGTLYQCRGYLVDVRKNKQMTNYADPLALTWAPAELVPLSNDIIAQVPAFLDICFITKDGTLGLATVGRVIPYSIAELFRERADYTMKIVVSGAGVAAQSITIVLRLGDSDDSTIAERG